MKKFFLTFGILLSVTASGWAENQKVDTDPEKKTPPPDTGTTKARAPMYFPVEVFYDDITRQVEVTSRNSLEGYMYLYNALGNIIAFAATLDETIDLPAYYKGVVNLYIDSETWTATGSFIIK